MADQIAASVQAQNRYAAKDIEANADELARHIKATDKAS